MRQRPFARVIRNVSIVAVLLAPAMTSRATPVVKFVSNGSYYRTGRESDPTPLGVKDGLTASRTTDPVVYAPTDVANWGVLTLGGSIQTTITDTTVFAAGTVGSTNPVTGNLATNFSFTDQAVAIVTFNLLTEATVTISPTTPGPLITSTGSPVATGSVLEPGTYTLIAGYPQSTVAAAQATFAATPEPASLAGVAALGALFLGRRKRARA